MEMKNKKDIRLYVLFLRYLTIFCIITVLLITVIVLSFYFGMANGVILPANYAEQTIKQAEEQIAKIQPFDESIIPFPCTYTLFDKNHNFVIGNMNEKEVEKAKEFLVGNSTAVVGSYLLISRDDGYCVIKYDVLAHFASPVLHKLFPKPELLAVLLFVCGFILVAGIIASLFGKKLKYELYPLIRATNAIKQQELGFEISPTYIREFNIVLNSINEMKIALETSLKEQWNMEQNRKIQISSIAHDIKTPLTIIKGNTELLMEEKLLQLDLELLKSIHVSSGKIEQYIDLLISATKAENAAGFNPKPFDIKSFIAEIKSQATELCLAKNITVTTKIGDLPEFFCGDRALLFSAISNILNNALEYSPLQDNILLEISMTSDMLIFTVSDNGKGFSSVSLKNAMQQFYTEQEGRSGKHYGMGLFIAEAVAQKHGGCLAISNKTESCGAIVTLTAKTTV